MCTKPWGIHKKNTGNKLERSLVPFHIRSQMTQMHQCYSKCVCVLLQRHSSWPSRIDRDYLITFRIVDSECHQSPSFCLEYGLGYTILSTFLFCLNSLVNLVLYTFRMTQVKAPSLVLRCKPLLRFSFLTIYNIYYAWSPLSILKGLLRGLRQMLSKITWLNRSCSKDKGNFLALCAQLVFRNVI